MSNALVAKWDAEDAADIHRDERDECIYWASRVSEAEQAGNAEALIVAQERYGSAKRYSDYLDAEEASWAEFKADEAAE